MTFQELDQLAIQWNEIANGHRSKQDRIITQIAQCQEEMVNEALHTIAIIEADKSIGKEPQKHNLVKLLDDYADSQFVYTEYVKLIESNDTHFDELIHMLYMIACKYFKGEVVFEAYKRVIESNFTKFVPVTALTPDQVNNEVDFISSTYNCYCKAEQVNGYWVFRDQNGKIRKPSTFKPVYLEDLV